MEHILDIVQHFIEYKHSAVIVSSFSIGALLLFLFLLLQATHRGKSVEWSHLVTARNSTSASLTKVIHLLGGIISSWVIIKLTLQEKLTWDLFSVYLAYCGSTEAFSKYMSAKFSVPGSTPPNPPPAAQNDVQPEKKWYNSIFR